MYCALFLFSIWSTSLYWCAMRKKKLKKKAWCIYIGLFIYLFFWSVCVNLQALVYDILPSTTAVFSYAIGLRKLSANKQFFVGAQTVVCLLQTTHIRHLFYVASSNKTKIVELRQNYIFFNPVWSHVYTCAWVLYARLLPQFYQYPNLSEGTDCVGGQLCGDNECPFSGVTKSCSLEEGAGNQCLECVCMCVCFKCMFRINLVLLLSQKKFRTVLLHAVKQELYYCYGNLKSTHTRSPTLELISAWHFVVLPYALFILLELFTI